MRERTPLEIHELTGSSNVRRELKRRLDAERRAEPTRYGVPDSPQEIDAEEQLIWDSLVTELREYLYRADAKRLFELVEVEVLLAKSFRAAKHGATFKGRPNPAHSHVEKYLRVRDKLKKEFTSRAPRPASSTNPLETIDSILEEVAN